jgi:hypothetical protein
MRFTVVFLLWDCEVEREYCHGSRDSRKSLKNL